jgi:hypothetical protein
MSSASSPLRSLRSTFDPRCDTYRRLFFCAPVSTISKNVSCNDPFSFSPWLESCAR